MEEAILISRAEAKQQGLVRYFTGEPCVRGHVTERIASSGRCLECNRLSTAARRAANPDEARVQSRARYAANPDKVRAQSAAWKAMNPERARSATKRWQEENRQRTRDRSREWARDNPERARAKRSRRRAAVRRAVPPWFGELDALVWIEAADLVNRRRATTGIDWHADHMIPLAGRKASGLHVASNCQVIPAIMNCAKRNRMLFTEPGEWIRSLGCNKKVASTSNLMYSQDIATDLDYRNVDLPL